MSTPSMLLLCGGAAASLASVWTLAGLSERSNLRGTSRVMAATALGLLGVAGLYLRTPTELRGQLLLSTLFGAATVLALGAGAAKLDAALAEKDGPRAVRRVAGLLVGTLLAMAAVALVSLEVLATSSRLARFAWAYMLPLVVSALVVFGLRGRLAGAGAIALGRRGLVLSLLGLALIGVARASVKPGAPVAPPAVMVASAAPVEVAPPSAAPLPPAPPEIATVASAAPEPVAPAPSVSAAASAAASASASAPPAGGKPGELQIESVASRGMLEADARGPVQRRFDKLQACLAEPKNQQSGALTLKVGIDASGSVGYVRTMGGDLVGTPLATCLLPAFYKMGFAAPASSSAYFEITLRSPPL